MRRNGPGRQACGSGWVQAAEVPILLPPNSPLAIGGLFRKSRFPRTTCRKGSMHGHSFPATESWVVIRSDCLLSRFTPSLLDIPTPLRVSLGPFYFLFYQSETSIWKCGISCKTYPLRSFLFTIFLTRGSSATSQKRNFGYFLPFLWHTVLLVAPPGLRMGGLPQAIRQGHNELSAASAITQPFMRQSRDDEANPAGHKGSLNTLLGVASLVI